MFEEDLGAASVATMYLLPEINRCLRHRLLALVPGTRIVSHQYTMGEWEPDRSVEVSGRDVHLWVIPARVGGVWGFRDSQGAEFMVDLHQTFDALSGDITRSGFRSAVLTATLRGAELRFTFDAAGTTATFSGTRSPCRHPEEPPRRHRDEGSPVGLRHNGNVATEAQRTQRNRSSSG